jgi:branched-chain amino acid transport system substrate-binding protein
VGESLGDIFDGVNAYFEMVNSQGGVHGRTIRVVAEYDDNTQASKNLASVRTLVEEDRVFAVLPVATPIFAGAPYLADRNIPTFGWVLNDEWTLGESLIGAGTTGIECLECTETFTYLPFIAQLMGVKKVGVLSYSAAQAKQCAEGQQGALKKYGFDVAFADTSLTFGFADISAQIARMKDSGIELLATCMDGDGSARVSKAMREAGLKDVKQYWPIGYDPKLLEQFPKEMEGVYMQSTTMPFNFVDSSPGLQSYFDWMEKTEGQVGESSLQGWILADEFTKALEAAGEEPTRQKLIDAIYSMTDYDADNILVGTDWTRFREPDNGRIEGDPVPACLSFIQVQDSEFEPVFVTEEEPWACVDISSDTLPDAPLTPEDFGL